MKRVHEDDLDYSDPYSPQLNGEWFTGIAFETDKYGNITLEVLYIKEQKEGFYKDDKLSTSRD